MLSFICPIFLVAVARDALAASLPRLGPKLAREPCRESLFAAVLTRPESVERRRAIRDVWRSQAKHWGRFDMRFALCSSPAPTEALLEEAKSFGDLLFLDCAEGYRNGALTRKVASALHAFLAEQQPPADFFLKTDDDSFVSTKRLCTKIRQYENQRQAGRALYMGVFAEGPLEHMDSKHFPNRDPSNVWYESLRVFPGELYPKSAKGGPGYVLSLNLVRSIVDNDLPATFPLNNEDKAVGVWIDEIQKKNALNVEFVNLPGTDGYEEHKAFTVKSGPWRDYTYLMHHNLTGKAIRCLHALEEAADPRRPVGPCFAL